MRQGPLERDINIAVNGCSGFFATSTQKGPFMAMLISRSRGTYIIFTCGEACKSRDDKKSVGGGGGVVVCPELLSKEEVELWFCPELLSQTLVNGKNDA